MDMLVQQRSKYSVCIGERFSTYADNPKHQTYYKFTTTALEHSVLTPSVAQINGL